MGTQLIYIKHACDIISNLSIENAVVKGDSIDLDATISGEENQLMTNSTSTFGSLNIQVEESNEVYYSQAVSEDVERHLQTLQVDT